MKYITVFIFLANAVNGYSQTIIEGTIIDSNTKSALPFCNVSIKGTNKGCIANEDGAYKISIDTVNDTLAFSYVGYGMQIIPAEILLRNPDVSMNRKSSQLKEVVVHADQDYYYYVVKRCRKKLLEGKHEESKVYFQLETEIREQPVEMLECYYNCYLKKCSIDKLLLKNGRIGLAESKDNGFFMSRNTTRAISYFNLTEPNEYLPTFILQYNKSKLKKLFTINSIEDDSGTYHIEFTPRKNTDTFFSGAIWVDKKTYSILKLNLTCGNASVHPFLPLFAGGSVSNVSMNISETFIPNGKACTLNHISFSYHLKYNNGKMSSRLYNGNNPEYEVSTNGIMYFYDYEKLFLLPYFIYDTDESDYRKITSMPYNESFWENNIGLIFTKKQMQSLEFFTKNGVLVNYSNKKFKVKGNYNAFEDNNIFWSDTNRIALKANHLDSLLRKDSSLNKNNPYFLSDLYHLQAQVFLDINPSGDSIKHFSASVFNVFESYFNLPEERYTDCFLNIYFDLIEIERRQMEKTLCSQFWNIQQMDSIYRQTDTGIEKQTTNYFKDVQLGKNSEELIKWNSYVFKRLNIDNMLMSGLKDR